MKHYFNNGITLLIALFFSLSMQAGLLPTNEAEQNNRQTIIDDAQTIILEHLLEHMLAKAHEKNEDPSEIIARCYQALTENRDIPLNDLRELIPSMITFVKSEIRAPRADAPDATINGALSGCSGCGCDLNQILAVLNSIQAKLLVLIACCNEVLVDLSGTFSVLANLSVSVTALVDLNPIFTALDACCNATFSALANLTVTATVDLNPVFTALQECCNSTFSAIAACCDPCGFPIPIAAPTTITQSGIYCLVNDINGSISIAADNVTLDMNGKAIIPGAIIGISIVGHQNVTVKNGRITNTTQSAIGAVNSSSITIDSVQVSGTTFGVQVSNSRQVIIKNCVFSQNLNTQAVCSIAGSTDVVVDGCTFRDNVGLTTGLNISPADQVIRVANTTGFKFLDSTVFNNVSYDIILTISTCTDALIQNSSFYQNTVNLPINFLTSPSILFSTASFNTIIDGCFVNNNNVGAATTTLLTCQSFNDDSSFIMRNSTVIQNSSTQNCAGIVTLGTGGTVFNNEIVNNTAAVTSAGVSTNGGTLIIANQIQGHTNNIFGGGTQPQISISSSTGTIVVTPSPATSYHNVIRVP